MKKLSVLSMLAASLLLNACGGEKTVYVPVHHTTVVHHRDRDQVNVPSDNSAEGFHAVERPPSYSN